MGKVVEGAWVRALVVDKGRLLGHVGQWVVETGSQVVFSHSGAGGVKVFLLGIALVNPGAENDHGDNGEDVVVDAVGELAVVTGFDHGSEGVELGVVGAAVNGEIRVVVAVGTKAALGDLGHRGADQCTRKLWRCQWGCDVRGRVSAKG